ncbi:MAG TPA: hypothetical protein VG893_00250, partial [Terracidiphilus sp.]|nr:hypothetical protein [Terracidiphilus sp.]
VSSYDQRSILAMRRVQEMIIGIRARRKELNIPERQPAPIFAFFDTGSAMGSLRPEINNVYKENFDIVQRLAFVSEMERKDFDFHIATPELGWTQAGGPFIAVVYEAKIDVPAERERLTKDIAKYEKGVAAAARQLGNEGFVAKAPAHIVEGLKKQAAETQLLLDKARAALAALPPE